MNYLREYQSFVLKRELKRRKLKNTAISMRALAKDLKVSPASLSRVISQERSLSKTVAKRVAERLKLNTKETEKFVVGQIVHGRKDLVSEQALAYKIIAEWEHYAIFEYLKMTGSVAKREVSSQFEIPFARLDQVLQNLELAKLIEVKLGQIYKLSPGLKTTEDVPSQALLDSHEQNAEIALRKLKTVPIESRDFSCVVLPVELDKVDFAKELIRKFRKDFIAVMGSETSKAIYQMNIQLFPLTKGDPK